MFEKVSKYSCSVKDNEGLMRLSLTSLRRKFMISRWDLDGPSNSLTVSSSAEAGPSDRQTKRMSTTILGTTGLSPSEIGGSSRRGRNRRPSGAGRKRKSNLPSKLGMSLMNTFLSSRPMRQGMTRKGKTIKQIWKWNS